MHNYVNESDNAFGEVLIREKICKYLRNSVVKRNDSEGMNQISEYRTKIKCGLRLEHIRLDMLSV